MIEITYEMVREFLHYDPESGRVWWKERDIKWFASGEGYSAERRWKSWNSRYAGKETFTTLDTHGYGQSTILGKRCLAHRIIWLWMTGEWPDQVDHKNGVRNDNRWENLQNVSRSQNNKNTNRQKDNKTGYRGVSWNSRMEKYVVQIVLNGVKTHLGYVDDPAEGFEMYVKAAKSAGFTDRHIYGDSH